MGTKKTKVVSEKAKTKTAATKAKPVKRAAGKGEKVIEMMRRKEGTTLAEIAKATDWQAHTIRAFISTSVKKHGLKVESAKSDAGDRSYRIL